MKNTSCLTLFIKYTTWNVLGMIALSCYVLADTFFIARRLGADGLTALNLAIPIYSFMHGCGLMIGMGGGTHYALSRSRNNADTANRIFTSSVGLTLSFALLFLWSGVFSDSIARILGANTAIFPMTQIYLKVILCCAPLFMLNNLLLCFVRNDGAPQLAMAAMIGGSSANIVLDYIFVFPLDLGMFGAALATGLAPVISLLILSPFFWRKQNNFHLKKGKFTGNLACSIVASGLPAWITEFSAGIVIIVFNLIILKLQGNVGVAAYGIIANLSLVVMAIYTGIAQGIQPIISSNHGAGKHADVRAILRYALAALLIITCAINVGMLGGTKQIVQLFNREHHALLQQIAETGIKFFCTAYLFAGFNIILPTYFTSVERPAPAHAISILRGFGLIVPMAFILAEIAGMTGVWCAFPVTEILVSLLGMTLLRRSTKLLDKTIAT